MEKWFDLITRLRKVITPNSPDYVKAIVDLANELEKIKMNDPNPPVYTGDEIKEILIEGES